MVLRVGRLGILDVVPVEVLLIVMVALVVLVIIVMDFVRVGVTRGVSLVMLGILGVNGLVIVRVIVGHGGRDLVLHLGVRRFLDGGPGVRLPGDYGLACMDWLGDRLDRLSRLYNGFGRRVRLAFGRRRYNHRGDGIRGGSLESFRRLRRQRHVLARLVGLFRNRAGVFGVLLQCAELFSGQRPGAIMIGGA
ncbi:hypothetical protein GCM10009712_04230 [Pseudarthrobacter sulfonivorans]